MAEPGWRERYLQAAKAERTEAFFRDALDAMDARRRGEVPALNGEDTFVDALTLGAAEGVVDDDGDFFVYV